MITLIKERLYNDTDKIIEILEHIGCTYIHKTKDSEIRFGRGSDSSGNANRIFTDKLHYESYSSGSKGDIITLVSDIKGMSIGESIKWLGNHLGLKKDYKPTEIVRPFGGFWMNLEKVQQIDESKPLTYPISRLDEYLKGGNLMWVRDGISLLTQEEFKIGLDITSNRITLPWFDEEGNLVGIMGRLNMQEVPEYKNKYMPLIAFNKGKVLYGFSQNYRNILESEIVIVCEPEKATMQGREYGYSNVVSLGGNSITTRQEKLLKSLCVDVIIALDEDMSREHCIEQAKKVKIHNPFFSNHVYILNMKGLPTKSCVFDLSKDEIHKAFCERLEEI